MFIPTRGRLPKAGSLPLNVSSQHSKYWVQESIALNPPASTAAGGAKGGAKADQKPAFEAFKGGGNRLDGKSDNPIPTPAHSLGYGIPAEIEEEDPELAAAIAASLGGDAPSQSGQSGGQSSGSSNSGAGQGDDFDADLAKAIAMSTQEAEAAVPAGPVKSEKELAREKRLAALEKRGL